MIRVSSVAPVTDDISLDLGLPMVGCPTFLEGCKLKFDAILEPITYFLVDMVILSLIMMLTRLMRKVEKDDVERERYVCGRVLFIYFGV